MALLRCSRLAAPVSTARLSALRARQHCTRRAGSSGSLETAGALLRGMHELGLPCFELEPASLRVLHAPGELYAALLAWLGLGLGLG